MPGADEDGPGYREAIESLPADLRPILAELASFCADHSKLLHETDHISYATLAAMVRDGWRRVPVRTVGDYLGE
jgi:hypothetical protein